MDTSPPCPNCGKPLPPNAPKGLCPECLLKGAFQTGPVSLPENPAEPKGPRFVPPSVEELSRQFPQLEILKFIGQGGMGAVYQARQKELDRIVALKILPPQVAGGAGFAERFAQEARALGKLNHPHIVTLYQFGQADGLFYFLMEYVDGITLQQLMQSGRIASREALAIVPQICDALQYAHQRGIVHRDIKPGNILLSKEGYVKIADFGVAKIVAEGLENTGAAAASESGELTGAGSVLGTPQYMAPEQMDTPQEVDHRADIYSLGVVFYEMLTGELPSGKLEPPSARARGLQIDVRLDEVVLRALEKQPARRYQEADTLKTVVETIATTPPVMPSTPKPEPAKQPHSNPTGPLPAGAFTGSGLKRTIKWVALAGVVMVFVTAVAVIGGIGLWRVAFHRGSFPMFSPWRRVQADASFPSPAMVTPPMPFENSIDPGSLPVPQLEQMQAAMDQTVKSVNAAASNLAQSASPWSANPLLKPDLASLATALGQFKTDVADNRVLRTQSNLAALLPVLEAQLADLSNSVVSASNSGNAQSAAAVAQASLRKIQAEMTRIQAEVDQAALTPEKARDLRVRFDAAQAITRFTERDEAMATVAKDAARAGDVDVVNQALGAIVNFVKRDAASGDAARLLNRRGRRNEAIEIAKTMNNFTSRDEVLAELAR